MNRIVSSLKQIPWLQILEMNNIKNQPQVLTKITGVLIIKGDNFNSTD